jgi:hypothetical protein
MQNTDTLQLDYRYITDANDLAMLDGVKIWEVGMLNRLTLRA